MKNTVIYQWILDIVFPKQCFRCQNEGHYICFAEESRPILEYFKPSSSKVDAILAINSYQDEALKEAIHYLKYNSVKGIASELSEKLYFTFGHLVKENNILVPVPLSRKRQRVRGFNQAEVLAEMFMKNNFILVNVLKRVKFTHRQIGLTKKERLENIKDSFIANQNIYQVKNKKVFLIDDVATTGATLNACAKVLKKAGAKMVIALVVARD